MPDYDVMDLKIKEGRIREYLEKHGLDAAVIGRQNNFAWLFGGGRNYVLSTSEYGAAIIIITKESKYLIANTMDSIRIYDEEIRDTSYELISLRWYEKSIEETALDIIKGKRVVSDTHLKDVEYNPSAIHRLHYPLTGNETEKYRQIAEQAENIIMMTAEKLQPGMSEREVEAMLGMEYASNGFTNAVILIGSDERIEKYRHPTPTDKKIGRMVMIAPAPRKFGLHVPITRMVFFGDKLPSETADKYNAVLAIEANVFANCVNGTKFCDIFELQKKIYAETGYPEEWRNHFQGGLTGYLPNDPTQFMNSEARIGVNQTFNWYITIAGVKVEELLLTNGTTNELISARGIWPMKKVKAGSREFMLPDILLK